LGDNPHEDPPVSLVNSPTGEGGTNTGTGGRERGDVECVRRVQGDRHQKQYNSSKTNTNTHSSPHAGRILYAHTTPKKKKKKRHSHLRKGGKCIDISRRDRTGPDPKGGSVPRVRRTQKQTR